MVTSTPFVKSFRCTATSTMLPWLPMKKQPKKPPTKPSFGFRISPENLVWVKRRAANEHRKPSALVDLLITQLREKEGVK